MSNTSYRINKADPSQRAYVLEHITAADAKERENAIIYVAMNGADTIVGRIVVKEQEVPLPLSGKCWYVHDLFIQPEYRRNGIATALVAEIKRQAEMAGVVYLYGSANPSLEASMFWLNQGFPMHAYGRKQADADKPLFYGNYHHFFSHSIRRKALEGNRRDVRIRPALKEEIARWVSQYAQDEKVRSYLSDRSDALFGYAAMGEGDTVKGMVLAFADSMQSPLDSTRWWTFLYVDPPFRHQGIGRSLVWRLYQCAQEKDAIQLTNFEATEDNIGFWHEIGFDIFFWSANSQTGKRSTTAMLRVK